MKNPWRTLSNVNPQREDGNRQIENKIFKALMRADLTGGEFRVVMSVIHHTWGFKKRYDTLSAYQIAEDTNLSIRAIRYICKALKDRRIIYFEPSKRVQRGSPLNSYLFNKHYDTWIEKRVKQVAPVKQMVKKGEADGIRPVNHVAPTKESIKETIQKKKRYVAKFEEFWPLYPRRKGRRRNKPETEELFNRLKESDLDLVIQAVKNYAAECEAPDGEYAKDPNVWLKKDRWRTYIEKADLEPEEDDNIICVSRCWSCGDKLTIYKNDRERTKCDACMESKIKQLRLN